MINIKLKLQPSQKPKLSSGRSLRSWLTKGRLEDEAPSSILKQEQNIYPHEIIEIITELDVVEPQPSQKHEAEEIKNNTSRMRITAKKIKTPSMMKAKIQPKQKQQKHWVKKEKSSLKGIQKITSFFLKPPLVEENPPHPSESENIKPHFNDDEGRTLSTKTQQYEIPSSTKEAGWSLTGGWPSRNQIISTSFSTTK